MKYVTMMFASACCMLGVSILAALLNWCGVFIVNMFDKHAAIGLSMLAYFGPMKVIPLAVAYAVLVAIVICERGVSWFAPVVVLALGTAIVWVYSPISHSGRVIFYAQVLTALAVPHYFLVKKFWNVMQYKARQKNNENVVSVANTQGEKNA